MIIPEPKFLPADEWEKFKNKMLAHLDGVFVWSARKDCDMLVTVLIQLYITAEAEAQLAKRKRQWKRWRMVRWFTNLIVFYKE